MLVEKRLTIGARKARALVDLARKKRRMLIVSYQRNFMPSHTHALIRTAQIVTRPELLKPVRRNLELSFHLLHADATVVTSISKRQDRGTRVVPKGLADGYHAGFGSVAGAGAGRSVPRLTPV